MPAPRPDDLIVIPGPRLEEPVASRPWIDPTTIAWPRSAHAAGAHLASVCTGMAALGEAGLAHELNNPAAAARRAASELQGTLERWRDLEAGVRDLPLETFEQMLDLERELLSAPPLNRSLLELSDREEMWHEWLEAAGIAGAYDFALLLATSAVQPERLDRLRVGLLTIGIPAKSFGLVIERVNAGVAASRLAAEIETSIGRVSNLVRGIKAYSYMDQGSVQSVDINQGIEATMTVLGHKIRAKQIEVHRDLDPDLPRIEAFGGQLNQVWTNLLDNAIDALSDGGKINISSARETEHSLRITVEDNGSGIPSDQQPRVFEPFFTTKPIGEGTGIGLDTVRRIVAQHRGSIWLESRPGMTRFSVSLPLQ